MKNLEEIAVDICAGTGVTRSQLGTGDFPSIKCGDINSELPQHFSECISFVNPDLIQRPKFFENGDVLVGALAHNINSIGKAVTYLGKDKCIAGNDVIVIRTKQNSKFLTYLLSSDYCKRQIRSVAQNGVVVHLHIKKLMKIKIPIPPIHIQNLIVSYLDK